MTEAEILTTIREEGGDDQEGSKSGQTVRKPSQESLVEQKTPIEIDTGAPKSPKARPGSPSYKNRPRTASFKDLVTKFRPDSYAELKEEPSSTPHDEEKVKAEFFATTSQILASPTAPTPEPIEEKEDVKDTPVVIKEKPEVAERPTLQIHPPPTESVVTLLPNGETPSKEKHKPKLTHKTPPRVVPKTPRPRPPPSPKLPKIPPSPVLMTKDDLELKEVKSSHRPPRSRAASVIQRAVRGHAQKRTRAFTNATVETKEALRISRTFQTIYDLRSQSIRWSDLKEMRQLSSGMFGEVHIAKHKGHLVVVKTLKPIRIKPDASERRHKKAHEEQLLAVEDFKKEMSLLTKLWHRNIVHLIGVGTQPQLFMVMEYMSGGSLKDILADYRQKKEILPRRIVFEYMMDCAQGMKYLHEAFPRILHRDLKPANLLITKPTEKEPKGKKNQAKKQRPELKIADFGLSRVLGPVKTTSTERYRLTGGTGSLRYMAPEVAANQPYNEKADVYGFGIILWEMLANDLPYKKLHTHNFYKEVVKKKVRPPLDLTWPEEVSALIAECWDDNPDKRPTFRKIIERLRMIKQKTPFFEDAPDDTQVTACGGCVIA